MNSPALAMAWQIWTRHRLGLKISAASLVFMIVAWPPILHLFSSSTAFVVTSIPVVLVSVYLANLLLFATEPGNLNSGYPRRMFVLPVSTRTLALWPLFFAILSVVALWLIIAVLIYQRGGYRPPLLLPAIAGAVLMAWFHATCWLPVKSPLLHCLMILIGFEGLVGVPLWLLATERATPDTVTVIGLVELSLILLLAFLGLTLARHGAELSFGLQDLSDTFWAITDRFSGQPDHFRAAADAQLWYEDRCGAFLFKGMTYFIIFSVYGLAISSPSRAGNKFTFLVTFCSLLGTPLMMMGMLGTSLGRFQPAWCKVRPSMTFMWVRPILTGELITVIYRLGARCVLQILFLAVVLTTSWVYLKGYSGDMAWLTRLFFMTYPGWKGYAILALAIALVPVMSWKMLTDNLVLVLTGRRWLTEASIMGSVALLMCLLAAALWCGTHPGLIPRIIPPLVWLGATWVIVKIVVALLAFRLALRKGLLKSESVFWMVILWLALAAATVALVHLALPPADLLVPRGVSLVSALCVLPLGRFALAPLSLDWNRHR